ncbi:MAG: ferredoxin-thioredoxin reductase catalytic domain-containing protein [Candidatus Heimdallarchaeaceae archaeon]|jgi:ferredoxin-thioredoxin reductase catalytic subunit
MKNIEEVKRRAESNAKSRGYFLTSDNNLLQDLLFGLLENETKYGYPSCPCRISSGSYEKDRDIICPCDYRDPDIMEFGSCYCNLYTSKSYLDSFKEFEPIPERRPYEKQIISLELDPYTQSDVKPNLKLFYCKQCGYVTFREDPPYLCPICNAKKEFFKEFKTNK